MKLQFDLWRQGCFVYLVLTLAMLDGSVTDQYNDGERTHNLCNVIDEGKCDPKLEQDVSEFADWLSAKTEKHWRLPSEAEIEWMLQLENRGRLPRDVNPPSHRDSVPYKDNTWSLVGDCWHGTAESSPRSGSAWKSACERADLVALQVWDALGSEGVVRAPIEAFHGYTTRNKISFRLVRE